MSTAPELQRLETDAGQGRFTAISERLRYPLAVYLVSRVLYLAVAVADVFLRNGKLGLELRNWDGKWFTKLAENGYPHTLPTVYGNNPHHGYSTLGFEPLYSMLMWAGGQVLPKGVEPAGLLISLVCGGIATVEISVLAERWWGHDASRRGILFFCFFPGTIVFSMVYAEGLSLALIAGALLCLEDRRWVLAGLLAGTATAVEPVALAIIPACGVVSLRELWRHGWRDGGARRSLWAPVLSVVGAAGTGIFMWFWTGTPLAVDKAQRIAWGEKSSPYAVWYQIKDFFKNEIFSWHGWSNVNLNLPAGFLGAVFLLWGLRRLWKVRRGLPIGTSTASTEFADRTFNGVSLQGAGVPLAAFVYTGFVAVLALTSDNTPPNPRMLVCAFPVLMAVAAPFSGRKQKVLLVISLTLLVAMSIGTFVAGGLRP
jgi:hypothetical protein